MKINLPKQVEYIIDTLNDEGFSAFVVGGCVRDSLMGIIPHDWDICTSATPEEIIEIFDGYKIIPTGIKHGTVTVVIDNKSFEITTYRIDGEYDDNRHPNSVRFATYLKDDLSRRDFTINAMAYHPLYGLIDKFGGRHDIKRKRIRCVGDPNVRFNEDALRILRAARFATVYGFNIEKNTYNSMIKNKFLLNNIAMERINSEITKALNKGQSKVLFELIKVVVPELSFQDMDKALNEISLFNVNNLYTKLAILFNVDCEKLLEILKHLKFDNETIKKSLAVKKIGAQLINGELSFNPNYAAKRIMRDCKRSVELAHSVVLYARCKTYNDAKIYHYIFSVFYALSKILDSCCTLDQMSINGNDLILLGLQGKEVGDMLEHLLELIILEKIPNNRKLLLEEAINQFSYLK